jgi:predicted transcriptional regulator
MFGNSIVHTLLIIKDISHVVAHSKKRITHHNNKKRCLCQSASRPFDISVTEQIFNIRLFTVSIQAFLLAYTLEGTRVN